MENLNEQIGRIRSIMGLSPNHKTFIYEQSEDPKKLSQVNLTTQRTFADKEIQSLYNEYNNFLKQLDNLHQQYGHNVRHKFPIPPQPNKKDLQNLVKSVKQQLTDDKTNFEKAYEFTKYIPKSYWDEHQLTVWDLINSQKGLDAMRAQYKNLPGRVFMDYYEQFGIHHDPNARILTKQERERIEMAGVGKDYGIERQLKDIKGVAKDFYYDVMVHAKTCRGNDNKTLDQNFYDMKSQKCGYFKWKGTWYNTETDMPIEQELKAYKDKKYPHNVVVDYFPMGQVEAGGGFGHIQAWSLDEPNFQINAMPKKADISAFVGSNSADFTDDRTVMYNQIVHELNKLNKESIVVRMNDKEYSHFKEVAGDWAGKYHTKFETAYKGANNSKYNILFSNCSQHTIRAVIPDGGFKENFYRNPLLNVAPVVAFDSIKQYYGDGRYVERESGVRFVPIEGRTNELKLPSEYNDPKYVINNALTVVSNKWTEVLQQTLWQQKEKVEKVANEFKNNETNNQVLAAKKALEALNKMEKESRKSDGKWDRTFKQGGATDLALTAIKDFMKIGYEPVPVDWNEYFKK